MRIGLVENWDLPISGFDRSPGPQGRFAGREMLITHLMREIRSRHQASILIYGHRGVGKTSLLNATLAKLNERDQETDYIVARIEGPQLLGLQLQPGGGITSPHNLLAHLIGAIRKPIKEAALKDEKRYSKCLKCINQLYGKATAQSFQEKIRQGVSKEQTRRQEHITDKSIIFKPSYILSLLAAFVLYAVPLEELSEVKRHFGRIREVVALLLATPYSVAFPLAWIQQRRSRSLSNLDSSVDNVETEAIRVVNEAMLHSELESLHSNLNRDGNRVVYLIDELDKLEDEGPIVQVLEAYKTLLTTSGAIFIFIGDEKFAARLKGKTDGNHVVSISDRPANYTLFTSRYFVPRPRWHELNNYLDSIFVEPEEISASEDARRIYEMFKHKLAFDASSDFFDLIQMISNEINTPDAQPAIDIESLSEDDWNKGIFHRAIEIVLDEYWHRRPYDQQLNENICRALYETSNTLLYGVNQWVDAPQATSVVEWAIVDFLAFLFRNDVVEREQVSQGNGHQHTSLYRYRFTGKGVREIGDSLGVKTGLEAQVFEETSVLIKKCVYFVNLFRAARMDDEVAEEKLLDNSGVYLDSLVGFGLQQAASAIAAVRKVYKQLRGYRQRDPLEMSDLQKHLDQVRKGLNEIAERGHDAVAEIMRKVWQDVQRDTLNPQQINLAPEFKVMLEEVMKVAPHAVVRRGERNLLVFAGDKVEESVFNTRTPIHQTADPQVCIAAFFPDEPTRTIMPSVRWHFRADEERIVPLQRQMREIRGWFEGS